MQGKCEKIESKVKEARPPANAFFAVKNPKQTFRTEWSMELQFTKILNMESCWPGAKFFQTPIIWVVDYVNRFLPNEKFRKNRKLKIRFSLSQKQCVWVGGVLRLKKIVLNHLYQFQKSKFGSLKRRKKVIVKSYWKTTVKTKRIFKNYVWKMHTLAALWKIGQKPL